ncbi:MAG TPA: amidohydrolase family protein [Gemmatimonadales bacterium]|nr:amidohydrolase family protein [Gemmatimonadales bacterium]
MRTITIEEHCASPGYLEGAGRHLQGHATHFTGLGAGLLDQLRDVDERRLSEMDAAGIDMQVLSLTSPGAEQLTGSEAETVARDANDFIAAAVARHPNRFAGFGTIPVASPHTAADELERLVARGFKGVMINGHARGRYLDDQAFWPILERAQSLNVPIYLHPTEPPRGVVETWYQGFSPGVSYLLANAGWGWHIETAVHVIRMILGGVFDRFPRLQVIVGHLGEGLPFMIRRLDIMPPALTRLERPVSAYLRDHIHYTISGFNFAATFLDLLLEVGVDRIMFSADYPYASMHAARAFLDQLPVSPADRERIAHTNAERLLAL